MKLVKRLFDVVSSGLALLLLAPVFLVVAVLIKASSPGTVFFRQERVGRYGQPFRIHKFRTLREGTSGMMISPSNDPRITGIGKVLRASKLDELPQLIDVFTGKMSVVGPRPEVAKYVDLWPPASRHVILSVRPGITDEASMLFRDEPDILARQDDPEAYYIAEILPQKAALYVKYVQEWSFLGDLKFIFGTLRRLI